MNEAFYIGATGLRSQQQALEVIANNVANMNTTAFKRSSVQFSELVSPLNRSADEPGSDGDRTSTLSGAMVSGSPRVLTQGVLRNTGQAMDLAINGDGFIELMGPSGQSLLWRGGTLQVNADGRLTAANGLVLKAAITVPVGAGALTIGQDGTVQAVLNGDAKPTQLGQIELALAKDPSGLTDLGGGLFQTANERDVVVAPPGQDGASLLAQGALEGSNVQLSDEMVNLLLTQRAYAANAQIVQAGDQLMSIANGLKR